MENIMNVNEIENINNISNDAINDEVDDEVDNIESDVDEDVDNDVDTDNEIDNDVVNDDDTDDNVDDDNESNYEYKPINSAAVDMSNLQLRTMKNSFDAALKTLDDIDSEGTEEDTNDDNNNDIGINDDDNDVDANTETNNNMDANDSIDTDVINNNDIDKDIDAITEHSDRNNSLSIDDILDSSFNQASTNTYNENNVVNDDIDFGANSADIGANVNNDVNENEDEEEADIDTDASIDTDISNVQLLDNIDINQVQAALKAAGFGNVKLTVNNVKHVANVNYDDEGQAVCKYCKKHFDIASLTAEEQEEVNENGLCLECSAILKEAEKIRGKANIPKTINRKSSRHVNTSGVSAGSQIKSMLLSAIPNLTAQHVAFLTDKDWSTKNCGLAYPMLCDITGKNENEIKELRLRGKEKKHIRYSPTPYEINGNTYLLTNDLYAKNVTKVKDAFIQLGVLSAAE